MENMFTWCSAAVADVTSNNHKTNVIDMARQVDYCQIVAGDFDLS